MTSRRDLGREDARGAARRLWLAAGVTVLAPALLVLAALGLVGDAVLEAGRDELVNRHRFHRMLAAESEEGLPLVLFLGDSTFKPSYPRRVAQQLEGRVATRTYWAAGLGPYQHYALLGQAIALEPDVVVLVAHLRVMLADPPLPRSELLVEIPLRELPRAVTLPFHAQGFSAGRIVLGSVAGALLPLEAFDAALGGLAVARESRWFSPLVPASWTPDAVSRLKRLGLFRFMQYAADFRADHPALRVLAASVELATRHGARALVIVSPVPVELLRRGGLYDEVAFAERVALLRETVAECGGELLDLHDQLPGERFRDSLGHFDGKGATIVGGHVLRRLTAMLDLPPRERTNRASSRTQKQGAR